MSGIDLTWLLSDSEENQDQLDLLANYYKEVANGPMADYRRIIQGGNKQGQNYFVHVLDGINVLHKLRMAGVVEMNDLEGQLLFTAYTIHDINKIPPYGGRDVALSYINIATSENIKTELERIDLRRFFPEWEQYLEDIKRLMLLHQHDAAPLDDLNRRNHTYKLRYERLLELGKLMYAIDNLDLSHTLSENPHKQNFLTTVNAVAERHWRWVTHRLGENRAFLSNLIHNTVVTYLKECHTHDGYPIIVDLLYYPEGVAYLLPEREVFSWSEIDIDKIAQRLAVVVADKKMVGLQKLIEPSPMGLKVSKAAIESGSSYTDILYVLRQKIDRQSFSKHEEYDQKIRLDLQTAAKEAKEHTFAIMVKSLLDDAQPIVPRSQELLRCGEMASAYRNLLEKYLKSMLKKTYKRNTWTHIYTLLNLPAERYALYDQVNHYRRRYFIARDCIDSLDTFFERLVTDIAVLTGEQAHVIAGYNDFRDYLAIHLELSDRDYLRNFHAFLQRYAQANHEQCCMCSSPLSSIELMETEVPSSIGVQAFSNRLRGGGREPKRNVCPICRIQLLLEKLTRVSFNRKGKKKTNTGKKRNSELYTSFYLHLYPYTFFTATYIDAMYSTLKTVCREDSQCLFLDKDRYYKYWNTQFEQGLSAQVTKRAQHIEEDHEPAFRAYPTSVNGISVPFFSEAVSATLTLPLNAVGENYSQQFLFGLTHALMIADFFGCRVVLSRSPFPLLSNEYMTEHALNFFVDGVPLNLRWLLPTNEYRSIETYRDGEGENGGKTYIDRLNHWQNEQPDEQGYAAYENISRRLSILYQLAKQLNLSAEESEAFFLEVTMAMSDDPLAVYRVVDLTIEKQLRNASSKTSANKRGTKDKAPSVQNHSSEQRAIYLSKRIAPLLAQLVKE